MKKLMSFFNAKAWMYEEASLKEGSLFMHAQMEITKKFRKKEKPILENHKLFAL